MNRIQSTVVAGVALTCAVATIAIVLLVVQRASLISSESNVSEQMRLSHQSTSGHETAGTEQFAVHIRRPAEPPTIELAALDPQGRTAQVGCSTCHSGRTPNLNNAVEELDQFHQGFQFQHGTLACYACHDPDNADALRLADGKAVRYQDVMLLCSQCHSSQATSFAHGAHGGMNGFWDRSRGPQTKNNCIDCHDPHAPQFPKMVVGFKPKDRFNQAEVTHGGHK